MLNITVGNVAVNCPSCLYVCVWFCDAVYQCLSICISPSVVPTMCSLYSVTMSVSALLSLTWSAFDGSDIFYCCGCCCYCRWLRFRYWLVFIFGCIYQCFSIRYDATGWALSVCVCVCHRTVDIFRSAIFSAAGIMFNRLWLMTAILYWYFTEKYMFDNCTCEPCDGWMVHWPICRGLTHFYPHMPIGKVWIHRLLFFRLFVCLYG